MWWLRGVLMIGGLWRIFGVSIVGLRTMCVCILSSVHEAEFALRTGFPSERIMFTGTSVTDETMEHLLEMGVLINIDSFSQMRWLARFAPEGLEVSVRWNPGEGAGFDPKVITAGARSHGRLIKFGRGGDHGGGHCCLPEVWGRLSPFLIGEVEHLASSDSIDEERLAEETRTSEHGET